MARDANPTVSRRRLAAELRRLREDAQVTGPQLAEALAWSTSRISRMEKAQVLVQGEDLVRLAEFYQVGGERLDMLLALAAESEAKGWWESYGDSVPDSYLTYVGLEAGAESMYTWQNAIFPGLLQTADYARAVMGLGQPLNTLAPAEIERRTKLRMRRQEILAGSDPLVLKVLIDESVLHRRFGSSEVMRDQLRHVRDVGQRQNVTLRILPLDVPHSSMEHSFVLLRFPQRPGLQELHDDLVYFEHAMGGTFEEGASETYIYDRLFYEMSADALSEEDSRKMIAELADRHRS